MESARHLALDQIRALERIEHAAWRDFYEAASEDDCAACGVQVADFGTALGTMAARADVLALNRAAGVGLFEPATPEMLDHITRWFSSADVPRFFVQVSPMAAPDDLHDRLTEQRFSPYNNWVKLYRTAGPPPQVRTDLRIEEIMPSQAAPFGRIVAHCFSWPEPVGAWVARLAGRPGWHHYLAFDGDEPVATSAFFAREGYAWMDFACTMPGSRARGAQGALLAQRVRDALSIGCHTLVLETAEQKPEKDALSYRNALRLGFREAYLRPNYLWKPPTPAA